MSKKQQLRNVLANIHLSPVSNNPFSTRHQVFYKGMYIGDVLIGTRRDSYAVEKIRLRVTHVDENQELHKWDPEGEEDLLMRRHSTQHKKLSSAVLELLQLHVIDKARFDNE